MRLPLKGEAGAIESNLAVLLVGPCRSPSGMLVKNSGVRIATYHHQHQYQRRIAQRTESHLNVVKSQERIYRVQDSKSVSSNIGSGALLAPFHQPIFQMYQILECECVLPAPLGNIQIDGSAQGGRGQDSPAVAMLDAGKDEKARARKINVTSSAA